MVLAAKVKPMLRSTTAIEPSHGLVAEVEPQVDRGREVTGAESTFQVAESLVIAGLVRGGFVVIVEPVDRLDVGGVLVLERECDGQPRSEG